MPDHDSHVSAYREHVQTLAMSCHKLAYQLAWSYAKRPELRQDRDDLAQVAMTGIIQAAERFDPALGVKFVTYAHNGARFRLGEFVRKKLRFGFGGTLGTPVEPLTSVRSNEGLTPILDLQTHEPPQYGDDYTPEELDRALHIAITPRERRILKMRLMEGQTLDRIAKAVGLTKERVRQLQEKAEDRVRMFLENRAEFERIKAKRACQKAGRGTQIHARSGSNP